MIDDDKFAALVALAGDLFPRDPGFTVTLVVFEDRPDGGTDRSLGQGHAPDRQWATATAAIISAELDTRIARYGDKGARSVPRETAAAIRHALDGIETDADLSSEHLDALEAAERQYGPA